jgi:LAGLIDADG DNA endonuclease family
MPEELRDLLVGILLGDAHIARRSSTGNSRLTYAQTAVTHKEYFDYVFSFFIPFCVEGYKPHVKQVRDYRTNKIYSSITFTTMQLPCFNVFKDMFYVANVKIVPSNIYELLTPKGLAF